MSRFYGSISGQSKTEATRRGNKQSGVNAHIRGWDVGVFVGCFVNDEGYDVCEVYETGGSNSPSNRKLLATVKSSQIKQERL